MAEHPHLQTTRRRLLETALGYYQNLIETHGDPGSRAELRAGEHRVRGILDELATLQGANLLGLAMDKTVQADLKLDEEQREQLAELHERASKQRWEHFREQRTLAPEVRRQKFYELAKIQEAGLSEILGAQELRRLRQIELQHQGARAFHEGAAVNVLKLTAEQKRMIRQIKDDIMAALFTPPAKAGSPGGFAKPDPLQFEKLMKVEMERILTVLSDDQRTMWQEMTGRPFEGAWRLRPFGPRPTFGPGGNPRGDSGKTEKTPPQ